MQPLANQANHFQSNATTRYQANHFQSNATISSQCNPSAINTNYLYPKVTINATFSNQHNHLQSMQSLVVKALICNQSNHYPLTHPFVIN